MEKQKLEELKVSIYNKLRGAINDGDKEKALELLDEIDVNRIKYRNFFLPWIDMLLTYIADNLGEEAVYETMRKYDSMLIRPAFKAALDPKQSAEDRLKGRAYMWTSMHGINIDEIQEDEEKFILKFKCPTGGTVRTMEQYGKTKKGHSWSYGQEGFCYYCLHCPICFEKMTIEQLGYPAWVTLPQPDGRCIQYLYKDPTSVPAEYYKRLGMVKKTTK